jgi:hypothetical protein
MKYTYSEGKSQTGWEYIKRSDDAFIPIDPSNSDYQRYLRWLENPDAEETGTIS